MLAYHAAHVAHVPFSFYWHLPSDCTQWDMPQGPPPVTAGREREQVSATPNVGHEAAAAAAAAMGEHLGEPLTPPPSPPCLSTSNDDDDEVHVGMEPSAWTSAVMASTQPDKSSFWSDESDDDDDDSDSDSDSATEQTIPVTNDRVSSFLRLAGSCDVPPGFWSSDEDDSASEASSDHRDPVQPGPQCQGRLRSRSHRSPTVVNDPQIGRFDRSSSPTSSPRAAKRRRHSRGKSKTAPTLQSPPAAIRWPIRDLRPRIRTSSGRLQRGHGRDPPWADFQWQRQRQPRPRPPTPPPLLPSNRGKAFLEVMNLPVRQPRARHHFTPCFGPFLTPFPQH